MAQSSFLERIVGKFLGGTKQERDIKRLEPMVTAINEHFAGLADLDDDALKSKTDAFRQRLADGETVDDLLPEAYAVVKETCRRHVGKSWDICGQVSSWEMVPFDVQLMGAVVLHEGRIAEMATGEGKTLVAILPLYLNALLGDGAHLVTVNDYLARRDANWMRPIFEFLGLTVGIIQHDLVPAERREAYGCDITYGTNNEFGFDYLRDNMAVRMEDRVQRGHAYAIVDEVDSVLIDEARTPLIISGPVQQSIEQFTALKPQVERVVRAQVRLVNDLLVEVDKLRKEIEGADKVDADTEWSVGYKLLTAQRGAPKNRRLMKLFADEPGMKKLVQETEAGLMRDKRLQEIDEHLHYIIDEKNHVTDLSDQGRELLAPNDNQFFILPDLSVGLEEIQHDESLSSEERVQRRDDLNRLYAERSDRIHSVQQLLRAYALYEKDVEYVVQEGKVIIVDEFTGRLMAGRRFSDGLHQALEAKENVRVGDEMQTLATITLQNYFRLYGKLAGMTGTAETEAGEFYEIYKLDVAVIPSNRPIKRVDYNDVIFRTRREKFAAILDEIAHVHSADLPVLVGTVSVEASETLSRMLKRRGIKHSVLNAKQHQSEAEIIAFAGQPDAVTIATNMAGRGTDIKLGEGVRADRHLDPEAVRKRGFHEEVDAEDLPGGLHIIGTERHESRRIDRQLRGRAGRQGDPGASRFFLSLEDDLMRLFAPERMAGLMEKLGVPEGEVIEHPWITKSIERAQKRVEARNFEIRKRLLDYDNVMNQQREVIYDQRLGALEGDDLADEIGEMIDETTEAICTSLIDESLSREHWDFDGLKSELEMLFLLPVDMDPSPDGAGAGTILEQVREAGHIAYRAKEEAMTPELMRRIERYVVLQVIDEAWRDHLYEVDQMREGIGWQSMAGKDPLIEYKREAFNLFNGLIARIRRETVQRLFRSRLVERQPEPLSQPARFQERHDSASAYVGAGAQMGDSGTAGIAGVQGAEARQSQGQGQAPRQRPVRVEAKVGRNDPCPCGSGKKYKKCHMNKAS